ncbi:MAG: hypothetical protein COX62_05900 [Deltaproteobacteria bacterium CG_4_10_14_0_2_um_filter_43_8]|nr:MAG: hypothetical protein COV43_07530 [Deltaproteobacteria bacterium CG11_big_fil_rev_8_21_14_0_20_42_23]PJA19834.1 MAG: hypothetical protein COX62_05900 [Deltaproteobacteria bacterium CG_4_10_14_0_2_um_filter_43_8]PJC64503.1 MAG: hypothetical protein CO021_03925 [Deltaproteobacteria bacterium CG_4_9_14_0_2_um_filter_42_21]
MKTSFELPFVKTLHERLLEKKPKIQVILGPRQVGKTTGLLQCLKKLKQPQHYISADDVLSASSSWILEQWQAAQSKGTNTILAIDEIQKIPQWSETIKKLWDEQTHQKKNSLKIILMGSSSLQMQKGLTESLTGRFELIHVPHWNYYESNQIHKMNLQDYLKYGGYPGSYDYLKNKERWKTFLKDSIIETVIGKDILMFSQVRSPALFRQAFEILCFYPAREISYNKLLGQLQEKGNVELVKHYIELYAGAYLIKTLEKYSNKAVLRKGSSPKILPLCPALVQFARPEESEQTGRLFELAVGLECKRFPGKLFYWRQGNNEVDYIYQEEGKLFAIEVKSGRKKTHSGLDAFAKQFKKVHPLIITPENFTQLSKEGRTFLDRF